MTCCNICDIGELFAQCPVDAYPSAAVEQVLDSSRYFVIRIQDGSGMCVFEIQVVSTIIKI